MYTEMPHLTLPTCPVFPVGGVHHVRLARFDLIPLDFQDGRREHPERSSPKNW